MNDEREEAVKKEGVPRSDPKARERGEENRKELDEIPEPGTDPLHEGP